MKEADHAPEAALRTGFPVLAVATAFAVLADALMVLALAWELADGGQRGLLGVLLAINAVARLLLMPLGGALADRYDKVVMLRSSAVVRVVAMVVLAWGVMGERAAISVGAMTVLGAATAVHYPADRAVVVEFVRTEALARANGTLQTIMNTGNIAGPAVAAALVTWAGGATTLLLAGAGYLCGAVVLLGIPRQGADGHRAGRGSTGVFASMAEGARYAWSDRPLFTLLMVVGTVNLGFLGPFAVGVPALVIDTLGGQPAVLAAIEASFAVGSILGAATVALVWKRPRTLVVTGSIALVAVAMAVLATTTQPIMAVAVMLLGGLGSGIANVVLITAIQHRTPRTHIGRVMSTVTVVTMGLAPVSLAATGLLLELSSPGRVIFGGAAITLAAAVMVHRPAQAVLSERL